MVCMHQCYYSPTPPKGAHCPGGFIASAQCMWQLTGIEATFKARIYSRPRHPHSVQGTCQHATTSPQRFCITTSRRTRSAALTATSTIKGSRSKSSRVLRSVRIHERTPRQKLVQTQQNMLSRLHLTFFLILETSIIVFKTSYTIIDI